MNTTENNKLIAEFMGYENIKSIKEHPIYKIPKFAYTENNFGTIETIDTFSPYFDDMIFHSDWNWLMEVVEKIESLNVIVEIRENVCYIETSPNNYTSELESTKIEAVYNACVEFIKWYNENSAKEIKTERK